MINNTLYDQKILKKCRTRRKEKTDRLCKRRKDFERQRLRQIQKAKGVRLTGRPELFSSTEDSDYPTKSVSSVPTAEYNKYVDYVVNSFGVERSDAEYAVDTIGPFHSLISYAHSMYEHNKDRMTFRGAIDRVSEGVFVKELDIQAITQEPEQIGTSLAHLLAETLPHERAVREVYGLPDIERSPEILLSELGHQERKDIRHRLYSACSALEPDDIENIDLSGE